MKESSGRKKAAPAEETPLATILIVEDEPGIRALMRKILRREKYEVLEAGSAEEAITVVSSHAGRIDLLLSDMMLPGISGRELAERLTRDRAQLRVVYISGFTSDEEVRAGAVPPGAQFLQKPFTLTTLMSSVRKALG